MEVLLFIIALALIVIAAVSTEIQVTLDRIAKQLENKENDCE